MAISNELSSEIAAAILAEKKNPQDLKQLKDTILRVHSALQQMSRETRDRRFNTRVIAAANETNERNEA